MKILQISDFHLRGDGRLSFGVVDTPACFRDTLAHLKTNLRQKPDAIVVTGDIADSGDEHAYRIIHDGLSSLGIPIYAVPGNHDSRSRMLSILADWCPRNPQTEPFLAYTVQVQKARLVMLDSSAPGSHSGHAHEKIMLWLEKELAEHPYVPTLIFMHHPPITTGLGVMDEPYENLSRLEGILQKAPWVRLCCGHMHRPIFSVWAGVPVVTAPAASMQIDLDFRPEGGDNFIMEAPGYLLHDWRNGQWNTHVCQIYGQPTYAGPYPFAGKVNPNE